MLAHLTLSLPSVCAYLLFCRGSGVAKKISAIYALGIRGVKIGKISTFFQPKAMIPSSKNQIFQKFLNCLANIELRESRIEIRGLFSYQIRR